VAQGVGPEFKLQRKEKKRSPPKFVALILFVLHLSGIAESFFFLLSFPSKVIYYFDK
jgi:hypothetical protein